MNMDAYTSSYITQDLNLAKAPTRSTLSGTWMISLKTMQHFRKGTKGGYQITKYLPFIRFTTFAMKMMVSMIITPQHTTSHLDHHHTRQKTTIGRTITPLTRGGWST